MCNHLCRASTGYGDDAASQSGSEGGALQRSMSLGSNADFNTNSAYEYRPPPLASRGLRCDWVQKLSKTDVGPFLRSHGCNQLEGSADMMMETLICVLEFARRTPGLRQPMCRTCGCTLLNSKWPGSDAVIDVPQVGAVWRQQWQWRQLQRPGRHRG